jgi:hypothetical protein
MPMSVPTGRVAHLSCFFLSRSGTVGAPVLALFARAGGDAAGTILFVMPRGLHRTYGAHHLHYHLFVLPPIAFLAHRTAPRSLALDSGTDSAALSFRGCGIRCHAGTHSLAHHRTGGGNAVHSNASVKTAHRPRPFAEEKAGRRAPAFVVWGRHFALAFLAGSFYDFNVWAAHKRVEKLRYMHRNLLKRGLVISPEQWRWSSYRFYLLDDAGPVRVNEGWTEISFRAPTA